MTVRAKAPLRISFAGGGTDVAPFPETEGGAVLSATIDRYVYGSLAPRTDGLVRIESVDLNQQLELAAGADLAFDGRLDLVKAAIRHLGRDDPHGYDLVIRSTAPPGSGLGSSSTVMVALVGLLCEHYQLPLGEYEIAALAHRLEREDLGIAGGLQDHYAATFGGFNFIEFGERTIVNPLRVRADVVSELELNLLLIFTGVTRESAHVIADQTARVSSGSEDTLAGMRAQKALAVEMKAALLRGEVDRIGEMLGEAWKQKKRMSPMISTPRIEEVYAAAIANGAIGGKVTGAGGGGYVLMYCRFESKHRVAEAVEAMGAVADDFGFAREGLTTWRA